MGSLLDQIKSAKPTKAHAKAGGSRSKSKRTSTVAKSSYRMTLDRRRGGKPGVARRGKGAKAAIGRS